MKSTLDQSRYPEKRPNKALGSYGCTPPHGTSTRTVSTPSAAISSNVLMMSASDMPYRSESAMPTVLDDSSIATTGMKSSSIGLGLGLSKYVIAAHIAASGIAA